MDQKVVLITGASSGFGKLVAMGLIEKGMIVYGAARRVDKMQDIVARGGHAIKMDVTAESTIQEGIDQIIKEQGRIDVLINNAGYAAYGFVETTDIDHLKRMFDVNVWGMVRCTQKVLPCMRKQNSGTIINISSIVGKVSAGFLGFYAASKHAVEAISDATRQEVGRFGINVSVIEPGAFKTGFDDVVHDELKKVETSEIYQPILKRFISFFDKLYSKAPTPEPVVKAIIKIVYSDKPRIRIAVGSDAKMGIMLKSLVSDKLFDSLMLKQLNMD